VIVERLDAEQHQYDLARNREVASFAFAIQLVAAEASKRYRPVQIMNTLKGVGTPQGSERLIVIGGVHMMGSVADVTLGCFTDGTVTQVVINSLSPLSG
jgi:hypothetical protein